MEKIKLKYIFWAGLAGAVTTLAAILILLGIYKPFNYSVVRIINPNSEIIKEKSTPTIGPSQTIKTVNTNKPAKPEISDKLKKSSKSKSSAPVVNIPTKVNSNTNHPEVLTVEQLELMKDLENKGLLLTPQEYCDSITGYYTALITVLIGLFVVFSILSYFGIRWKAKSDILSIFEEMLDDSIKFRTKMYSALDAEFTDTYVKKDEITNLFDEYTYDIKEDIETLKNNANNEQVTTI